jgi:hypothetical protein
MMTMLYLLAVWVHLLTVAVWIGAMVFEDPQSTRFFSRLANKMHGVGWYAQGVLWSTGLYMLSYRGIGPSRLISFEFIATPWGQAMWAKLALVLLLGIFQATVGHHATRLIYGYVLVAFIIVGISVVLVRPLIF